MKIWTVTYDDCDGTRTEVFNSAEGADKAAHAWVTEYWDADLVEEHGLMPQDWTLAYHRLCDTCGFMDSIHVEEHDVHAPEPDEIEQIMIEAVNCNDELEVDSNAVVSWGDDPGAFVQTWSWVRYDEVEQDMAIIEESGTVWYFDVFAEFLEAWAGAPETARFERGTPELLEKSEGANDAWEFLTRGDRRSGNV